MDGTNENNGNIFFTSGGARPDGAGQPGITGETFGQPGTVGEASGQRETVGEAFGQPGTAADASGQRETVGEASEPLLSGSFGESAPEGALPRRDVSFGGDGEKAEERPRPYGGGSGGQEAHGENRDGPERSKRQKEPSRRRFLLFGTVILVLSIVLSGLTGALSSFVTVRLMTDTGKKESSLPTDSDILYEPSNSGESEAEPSSGETAVSDNSTASEPSSSVGDASSDSSQTVSGKTEKTKGEVYAESVNSIVGIKAVHTERVQTFFGRYTENTVTSTGSGFFITNTGYIVTNYHVIEDAETITVSTYSGEAYEATVRGYEASNDLAVIKIQGEFTPVRRGDSSALKVGDDILVIGNALGELSYTFTDGVVSYLNRAITSESGAVINMFQTNAAINEGNSGGPVYNMYGEVVGIASAKYASSSIEGLGFFIPINDVNSMIADIISTGYVTGKPSMGISVQPVTASMSARYSIPVGLYIVAVGSDTAASKAGLKAADVITAVNGSSVQGTAELSSALATKKAGDAVTVTVSRSGAEMTFTLTLDEYTPSEPRTDYSGVYDY